MINERQCKKVCCEEISLIDNYENAVSDGSQMWHCHHRLGVVMQREKLVELGLYFNRPAMELIFLKDSDHRRLHGIHYPDESKRKISEVKKGEKTRFTANIILMIAKEKYQSRIKGKPLGTKERNARKTAEKKTQDPDPFAR